jgi:hypothetical protein
MGQRFAIAVVFILLGAGATAPARAQQPVALGQPAAGAPGWSFNVAPYLWIASVNANLNFTLPPALGGSVSANPSIGFGDVISNLNFAAMATAEARYDRFSLVTDFLYLNLGGRPPSSEQSTFPTIRRFRSRYWASRAKVWI